MSVNYQFRPDVSLYDFDRLQQQLLDSPKTRILLLKQALGLINQRLDQAFYDGADIRDLIYGRAWAMDQLLACIWQLFDWPDQRIALLAVGGYGRGELHPKSDIDLLILLKDDDDTRYRQLLSDFITCLWDIKLDVGHSVRSLADCEREARADITVATNLLENRTLVGSDALRKEMVQRLSTECMWPSAKFFEAKWQEQITRHYKFNNSEYSLEPNIKSSPGGLRDIQMIGWVAKRHFNATSLQDLLAEGFLTETEMRILEQGQCFLWQVRYALHMISGRAEDRLLFDYQRQLAVLFGYLDTDKRLAVEQFMKRYFRVVTTLTELNDVLLQHFEEVLLKKDEEQQITPINRRFQIRNGLIEHLGDEVFEQHPFALIEVFLLMAEHSEIEGVRANTIRALRDHRHLIDEAFRRDLRASSLFMELLRSSGDVALQLTRMSRYGMLGRYLPEFGHAVGLTQHDLFHVYTVDAHTLRLLRFMQRFRQEGCEKDFPLAAGLVHQLPKLEILWLAGLYHDLGKGRGGDHSELGAKDALLFCERHQLSKRDTHLICWLIEHHLLMSMTAQKQDLSDPDVIRHFAERVGDQVHLDYLYVLTVADINATNPTLWNGWRAALLNQLYTETTRAFRRGLENPIDPAEWVEETQQQALSILRVMGVDLEQVQALWATLDEDYFLQDAPSEVAWHTQGILAHAGSSEPLVLVAAPTDDMREGGTKVFIHARDAAFGFAATAATMDRLGLSIHDARISTSRQGFTLNTLIVLEQDGQVPRAAERLEEIRQELITTLKNPEDFPALVQHHTPRQLKYFTMPTQVYISNDPSNLRTLVEVIAPDRPGLLARIGRIFVEFNLWLQNAKIATLGERVEDVFFITQQDGSPLSDPVLCQRLQARICEELDRQVREPGYKGSYAIGRSG
ncbi:[protein-PII] uridylyltransferase [Marinospirillum alkaliphilum]|uniref:Bifunctional uridylyltransferase/uridylyl-removing enzyme n=1 Tax=Marinospirillum alkaliphilum DSM 21637 TaxID=1122209 RepID=A0A1K1W2U5_9GAMM|nr:[protein-PII] uridylyltransferase [Marinospirillum alkaliphilum]SFX31728.1 UTP--GlnB (protein PII) uridylyltransferase, GlnD [Marinospirillum alkaliphilum DSM 21637]